MKVLGVKIKCKEMVKVFNKMEISMKVNGKIVKEKEKVSSCGQMVINMKEHGQKIKEQVMDSLFQKKAVMKVDG